MSTRKKASKSVGSTGELVITRTEAEKLYKTVQYLRGLSSLIDADRETAITIEGGRFRAIMEPAITGVEQVYCAVIDRQTATQKGGAQ